MTKLKALLVEEEGQGMVEYGLIIALVAVALIAGLEGLTGGISKTFEKVVAKLPQ